MEDCAKYLNKIKVLNESIWEGRVGRLAVEDWLNNFDYLEQAESLFVLSNFMYFGSRQMRTLMNAMYRDLYRAPIVYSIRKSNGDTMDSELIESKFIEALKHTKFLGIGNPSESGCHLLYFLRQENELPKTCFAHTHELFKRKENGDVPEGEMLLRNENVERYVFIDDFCGSGEQAKIELKGIVADLKKRKPDCIVSYYVLFATTDGLSHISSNVNFDEVEAVVKLDDSFKLFSDESRYFKVGEGQQKENLDRTFCE